MVFRLRHAKAEDAADLARIMRASMSSHEWMPVLHTPAEDIAYMAEVLQRSQPVIVACKELSIVGFIAMTGDFVEHLHVDPSFFNRGIGSALLDEGMRGRSMVWLNCFLENHGARRFYERHGFRAESFSDGAGNEERLPDAQYVWRSF